MDKQAPVNGTLILVLGVVGLALSPISGIGGICGLVAWGMGHTAIQKLDEANIYTGQERSNASIGRICGMIAVVLSLGRLLLIFLGSQR